MEDVRSDSVERSWSRVLGELTASRDLDSADVAWAMSRVMEGNATPAQIAAFGVALKTKGVTSRELDVLASTMLDYSRRVSTPGRCLDIVGTGGDRHGTVNISTMATIVVSALGVPVVKHGNRAASSKSGGADVLEALGVAIDLDPADVETCLERAGVAFCFAPVFHPALRFAAAPRKEIGIPTVFNVLGPLTNPAAPTSSLIGCAFPEMLSVMAGVFARRRNNALVVRGSDGLDEVTVTGPTDVMFCEGGDVTEMRIHPEDVDLPTCRLDELRGGDGERNARVARDLLDGKTGPIRDAVVLNSAAALVAFEPEGARADLVGALGAAKDRVERAIDSGTAAEQLARWASVSAGLRG